MAAIFGLVGPHSPEDLNAMAERLAHRGPARHIESADCGVSVGAIGKDPDRMVFRDGSTVAVAAGRLYVGGEASQVVEPPSSVIDRLFRSWTAGGIAELAAVDGDYAAIIVSDQGRDITMLRDYFGCIPLFWGMQNNGCLAFASEYKAILAIDNFAPEVDRSMLQYLQAAKRMPVGRTLLKNVHAVEPGATTIRTGRVIARYDFEPLTCDIRVHDEETAKRVVNGQFREALRRRSAADDPIGLALSGGIDSISMAFQLRSIFPEREIHTFCAGHGDKDPEMVTAKAVASRIGAIHHPVVTPPTLVLDSLRKLVWHMEDPCARSEALQLMRIGEVASGYVRTLLSGQGADGLFAGMPRHKLVAMAGRLPFVRAPLFEIFDLTQIGLQPDSLVGRALAAALYRGKVPPVPVVIGGGSVARPERIPPGPDFLNRVLAAGYQKSASQDTGKFERTFGASGLGYTSPCLDVSFARTAFTIDERLKIRKGAEKYIFRHALASVVPEEFRNIPKHPQHMQYDIAFADCLDEMADRFLAPDSVRSRGLFEPSSIDRLRRRTPRKPYAAEAAMRLWTAITTEIWARHFLDRSFS